MTRVLWLEKGEGNHWEGRMTVTAGQFDVAVKLGEMEEPKLKPRPLAWSQVWLVGSFTETGNSEEEQEWGGDSRRAEFGFGHSVRWNNPNGNVDSGMLGSRAWGHKFGSHCSFLCISQPIPIEHLW